MVPTERLRRLKSKLIQKLLLHTIILQESYTVLVDMGMIWRMATPSPEDHQTQDGTIYKCLDYFHKVKSIIFLTMIIPIALFV